MKGIASNKKRPARVGAALPAEHEVELFRAFRVEELETRLEFSKKKRGRRRERFHRGCN
ncbi:MAG TPA: hypothetical protein VGC54_07880 [Planctomycetota bacterium]